MTTETNLTLADLDPAQRAIYERLAFGRLDRVECTHDRELDGEEFCVTCAANAQVLAADARLAKLAATPPVPSDTDRPGEIRARLDAATPGPWKDAGRSNGIAAASGEEITRGDNSGYGCVYIDEADRSMIANAPSDIAYLLEQNALLEGQLATARERHVRQRRYVTPDDFEGSFDDPQWIVEAFDIPLDQVHYFDVCAHCGALEVGTSGGDYRDSRWPCADALALGLGEGATDA
jgi:hypothetical protein